MTARSARSARWGFAPDGRGGATVHLGPGERAVVLDVVEEVAELLAGRASGAGEPAGPGEHPLDAVRLSTDPLRPPRDPALHRLLPDGSRDDPVVAEEFRRLSEDDVRTTKLDNLALLRAALRQGPGARVAAAQAPALAAALTDLRLVLAERLGIRTDADTEALVTLFDDDAGTADGADDAEVSHRFRATVYTVLGMLQESLVEVLTAGLPDDPPGGRGGVGGRG